MKDISVCVLTYNPVKEKLRETLMSIMRQKNIEFEIIVSDDGSEDNLFEYITGLFKQNQFTDYKLIANKKNEGTVINCYRAVKSSAGKYIKAISPGDELYTNTTLYEWVGKLSESDYQWSFSDVICYRMENSGMKEILSLRANPQIVECYGEKDIKKEECIWNYIILKDLTVGAATLIEKDLLLDYLELIKNKVVYAEDHVFRLMMFDGICPLYYNSVGIWYEYGSGISTSNNNVWLKRLDKDWDVATDIMLNRSGDLNNLQIKMKRVLKSKRYKRKYLSMVTVKGNLSFRLKRKLYPRMTARY